MSQPSELNYAMDAKEFAKYLPLLKEGPFVLYPTPENMDSGYRFEYVSDTDLHVVIRDNKHSKTYHLPLVVIEFANPGVLRLTRKMDTLGGSSFV